MHLALFIASAFACGCQSTVPPPAPQPSNYLAVYEYFNRENAFFSTSPSLPGSNWMLVKKAFCLSSSPNGPFKSLQYWWKDKGSGRNNNFYTPNADELGSGIDPAINTPDKKGFGYTYQGNLGYISTASLPLMVPLYRSYNGGADKHYYTIYRSELTTGQQSLAQKDSGGYGEEPSVGYVWPPIFC